jgi:cardiolipin synthase (CMP-forming)
LSQIPNLISLLRLLSAPVLGWLVIEHRFGVALIATLAAGATDWLDGWTARHWNHPTRLGLYLDPLADKAMLVTLFLCCGPARLIPVWLVCLVMGRDAVILVGTLLVRLFKGPKRFLPLTVGKVCTFFQILSVLMVLIHGIFTFEWLRVLKDLALAEAAFFTGLSGLAYIRKGIGMAREAAVERMPGSALV